MPFPAGWERACRSLGGREGVRSEVKKDAGRLNPWLTIPAKDYEGHMASPAVGQLQFLCQVFRDLILDLQPQAVAVLGCATGNGFDHIDPRVTRHVLAIDINPEYLQVLSARFRYRLPGLELVCADVAAHALWPQSFDLIHCALVLEYVDPAAVVPRAAAGLRPGGTLAVVLQLASSAASKVSDTPYVSLRRLEPVMRLVEPSTVRRLATSAGLRERDAWTETLDSGKSFFVGLYEGAAIDRVSAPQESPNRQLYRRRSSVVRCGAASQSGGAKCGGTRTQPVPPARRAGDLRPGRRSGGGRATWAPHRTRRDPTPI